MSKKKKKSNSKKNKKQKQVSGPYPFKVIKSRDQYKKITDDCELVKNHPGYRWTVLQKNKSFCARVCHTCQVIFRFNYTY